MKKAILYSLTAWSLSLALVACGSKGDGGGGSVDPNAAPTPATEQGRTIEGLEGLEPAEGEGPTGQVNVPSPASSENLKQLKQEARTYSGSSNDYLRIKATADVNEEKNENQRLKNMVLANSISAGRMRIDYNATGDAELSVTLGKNPKTAEKVQLVGELTSRSTILTDRKKRKAIYANLECWDVGTTCENMVVDLFVNGANAKIIFRRTNVKWVAQFPKISCMTQECEDLYTLARQTEMGTFDKNTARSAKLETMEVINGRSTFKFILLTNAEQVISIAGDLISPLVSEMTNQPANLSLALDDVNDGRRSYRTDMQDSLKDVRVVSNDGRGKIEMLVYLAKQKNDLQDGFALTVTRINKPIRSK
jgi:hypothetical protein